MTVISRKNLYERLKDKVFRSEYVSAHVRTGIAQQIRTLRNSRGWSQGDLGTHADKPQSVIARLENPDYGKFSVQSLLELASAFDVALTVSFVPFREFVDRTRKLSPDDLAVQSFEEETLEARAGNNPPTMEISVAREQLHILTREQSHILMGLYETGASATQCFDSSHQANVAHNVGHVMLRGFPGDRSAYLLSPEIAARALEK